MAEYTRFQSLKILRHYDTLEAITRGDEPYPIEWVVYPSNACNHKCVWCMFRQNGEQFGANRVVLPRETLLRFVHDAARLGGTVIQFEGGGEPLINAHTLDALWLANSLGIKTAMSTNGRLLTPAVARAVDYLRISLNAGTAAQHWRTNHGADADDVGDWDEIVSRIAAAVPVKRKDISLGFVLDADNYHDIPAFIDLAAELGVDFVHIRPAFWYDPAQDARVRAIMPAALALCQAAQTRHAGGALDIFAITEKFDGYWTPRAYHACRAVWTGVVLRATGNFAVCKDRTDLVWGNTPNYKAGATFEECWHSDERRALVASIHDGDDGALTACPRCVWGTRNTVLQAIERDDFRIALV
jgi:sulfatase maturation enzyme AslB (radical SAM superfamily)